VQALVLEREVHVRAQHPQRLAQHAEPQLALGGIERILRSDEAQLHVLSLASQVNVETLPQALQNLNCAAVSCRALLSRV
jgi:hypothetical protein